jgi:hypothetical protein
MQTLAQASFRIVVLRGLPFSSFVLVLVVARPNRGRTTRRRTKDEEEDEGRPRSIMVTTTNRQLWM